MTHTQAGNATWPKSLQKPRYVPKAATCSYAMLLLRPGNARPRFSTLHLHAPPNQKASCLQDAGQFSRRPNELEDLAVLHEFSCAQPELFWPIILQRLKVQFHAKPCRWVCMVRRAVFADSAVDVSCAAV